MDAELGKDCWEEDLRWAVRVPSNWEQGSDKEDYWIRVSWEPPY